MHNGLSFGIGCFHFGLKKTPPFRFEGSEYIRELRAALQSISNIDKISVDCEEEFKTLSIDVSEELPNIQNGPGFFPIPLYMCVEFEVYIPLRIQAELVRQEATTLRTFTERFRISIYYTYHLPVTFVELVNPSQESTPSDAVQIVREFLEREFNKSKSDYIQFEFLGPSPFPADCFIYPGKTVADEEVDWIFQARRLARRGCDQIVFEFNPRFFAKATEARDAIIEEVIHELGFFYFIVQREVGKINDWIRIQGIVDQLITIERMKRVKGFLEGVFTRSKLISEAFTAIAEFQSNEIDLHHDIQTHHRHIRSGRKELYFESEIDDEIKERMSYPTKEIRELVSFFESRRARTIETLVVLGSAIVGGAIGGLLAILLSN